MPGLMRNSIAVLGTCLVVMLGRAVRPTAEPPPLEPRELEKGSDLIVEADVLSVSKAGRPDTPVWEARLRIRKTLKGHPPSDPMIYHFLPPERGVVGGRNESVFAGSRVRLYLFRDKAGEYSAWAPNSVELLESLPRERMVLPTQWGETIEADGSRHLSSGGCWCCPCRHRCRYYRWRR